uniref:Calsequestrin n=1 Tax=Heterorhabditis bacteriophora TaxID=37862 RepID=A0A1I7X8T8_HETBA
MILIVTYFNCRTLKEFEEAAEDFMGEVEFFAVVTSKWARKVGLKRVGEVQMLRPFEEDPIFAPTSADTGIPCKNSLVFVIYLCCIVKLSGIQFLNLIEEEFEDWVEKHKEPVMQKLTLDNYFNVWVNTIFVSILSI